MPKAVGEWKICSKCREKKHISEFNKDRSRIDGLEHQCQTCKRARHREYKRKKSKDPEWRKKQVRIVTEYRKTPKGKRVYQLANQRRVARVKESIVDLHEYDILFLLHFQKNMCGCCKRVFSNKLGYELDHILPLIHGGNLVLDNVQLLCRRCNAEKHDKFIRYIPELCTYFEDWT